MKQQSSTDAPKFQGQLVFEERMPVFDPLAMRSDYVVVSPARKLVRPVSIAQANKLRDEAKQDRAEGRETKFQRVHRCLAAYKNFHGYWPTAAELTRWMAAPERREIPAENINLVAPKLSIGENGDVKRDKKTGTMRRIGGGLYRRLPLRTCRVTGGQAHPVAIIEAGGEE